VRRTGKEAEVVFSEPAFRVRWDAYLAALTMMGEMVEGVCVRQGDDQPRIMVGAMIGLRRPALDHRVATARGRRDAVIRHAAAPAAHASEPDTIGAVMPIGDQAGSEAVAARRKPAPATVRDDEWTRCAQPRQVIALIGGTSRART
jgi:hypothetical protein